MTKTKNTDNIISAIIIDMLDRISDFIYDSRISPKDIGIKIMYATMFHGDRNGTYDAVIKKDPDIAIFAEQASDLSIADEMGYDARTEYSSTLDTFEYLLRKYKSADEIKDSPASIIPDAPDMIEFSIPSDAPDELNDRLPTGDFVWVLANSEGDPNVTLSEMRKRNNSLPDLHIVYDGGGQLAIMHGHKYVLMKRDATQPLGMKGA